MHGARAAWPTSMGHDAPSTPAAHLQTVGIVAIQVVAMQSLVANKPEPLIQPQRPKVGDLRLQHRLVAASVAHRAHCALHKLLAHAALAHAVVDCKHRNVPTDGAAAMPILLADDRADDARGGAAGAFAIARGGLGRRYEAEGGPVVDEVAVSEDGVGLTQVHGDEVNDALQLMLALVRGVDDIVVTSRGGLWGGHRYVARESGGGSSAHTTPTAPRVRVGKGSWSAEIQQQHQQR